MKILISGTPGTGKTQVSGLLAEKCGFKLIAVNDFAEAHGLILGSDTVRDSLIIDEEKLKSEIAGVKGDVVVDGHLAHFCKGDLVVVLRTNPTVLEKRLSSRKWTDNKVIENIQSEILDVILQEAVEINDSVIEIDTTDVDVKGVCDIIISCVKNKDCDDYRPGNVSWLSFFDQYFS